MIVMGKAQEEAGPVANEDLQQPRGHDERPKRSIIKPKRLNDYVRFI